MSTRSPMMKRIVVTGGNKGIGRAICARLLSEWTDTHVILGSRDADRGREAVEAILREVGGGDAARGRLECIELDVSSDESVAAAASKLEESGSAPLYGIINNAGVGWGYTVEDTVNTNYFGIRRVNDKLGKLVKRPGGRIVNVASASGPNFVAGLSDDEPLEDKFTRPWTIPGGIAELDEIARTNPSKTDNGYGFSKALVNAYTVLHARTEPDLVVNSCTPGWIKTDLTAGSGATGTPEKGAVPPCHLMMDESFDRQPTGRYYGSDCVRSPLHFYRGPGDEPYVSDEDLSVEVSGAKK